MDPVTHALLGAAAARVAVARPLGRAAWLPGAVGALLPDADALIRSQADPLLYAEYHRHFTHALLFVPAGGAIAALPWLLSPRTRRRWAWFLAAATIGYATHGPLDASTTYGTLLLWPFSSERIAWNAIAIVDPLFTLVLLAGVGWAAWRRSVRPAAAALLACAVYLGMGVVQRDRAMHAQAWIAAARGHAVTRGAVFPGFGTNMVWRSLYLSGETFYMDRIRVSWTGAATWRPGSQVNRLRAPEAATPWAVDARLTRDFWRFHWFADGWVARAPADPEVIGDARYSSSLERFEPVWGIRLADDGAPAPLACVDRSRERRVDVRALWDELRGNDGSLRPLPGRR